MKKTNKHRSVLSESKDKFKILRFVIKEDSHLWLIFVLMLFACAILYAISQKNRITADFPSFMHFIDGILVSTIASFIFYFINFSIPEVKRCTVIKRNLQSLNRLFEKRINERYSVFLDKEKNILPLRQFNEMLMDSNRNVFDVEKIELLLTFSLSISKKAIDFINENPTLFSQSDTDLINEASDKMKELQVKVKHLDSNDLNSIRTQFKTVYHIKKVFCKLSTSYCA